MTDDKQLLRDYVRDHSEPALSELVSRHIDLVYATALRMVAGDSHLAQDITQLVFIHLARNAWRVPADAPLAGWLHRHTCFTACSTLRAERRRKNREQIAVNLGTLNCNMEQTPWETLAPHVDEALNALSESDRHAIVLRFLKQQDFRTLGTALGISEDAAQKRVARALEKLRTVLGQKCGATLTTSALAAALATHSATAAPAGLALAVSSSALAASAQTSTLLTLLKFMAATKIKVGLITAVVGASVLVPLSIQYHAQAELRARDQSLQKGQEHLASLRAENERLTNAIKQAQRASKISDAQLAEVLKLRSEVGHLITEVRKLTTPPSELSAEERLEARKATLQAQTALLKQYLAAHPDEQIPELAHFSDDRWIDVADTDLQTDRDYARALSRARDNAEGDAFFGPMSTALRKYVKEHNGEFPHDLMQLTPYLKSPIEDAILQRYEIVPVKSLAPELQTPGDWAITQKTCVNESFDTRTALGIDGSVFADERVTNRWKGPGK